MRRELHAMSDSTLSAVSDPRLFASIVRSLAVRFVSGSMLLSGVYSAMAGFSAASADAQFSCALAAAVCFVAAYHYFAIVAIRAPCRWVQPAPPARLRATELRIHTPKDAHLARRERGLLRP